MVTGRATTSYKVFNITWPTIIPGNASMGTTPPKASGKKMMLSALSPKIVLRMARAENLRFPSRSFILLMT